MRRYNIISGIFLILSIIDLALTAPVLVQEKRQACVDVVHTPRDVITVLGKRGDDELEKLLKEYFKTWGKPPVESSDAPASSSSAPLGSDHGSTSGVPVQAPAPNPVSSTANPNPLMEPALSPSWTSFPHSSGSETSESTESHSPLLTPTLEGYYVLNQGVMEAHAPQPNPNLNLNPKKRPLTGPDPDLDFDWAYWMNLGDPPPKRPVLSKEFDQGDGHQVVHAPVQQPDPGPPTNSDFDRIYDPMPVSVAHPPSTGAGLPTEPHEAGSPPNPVSAEVPEHGAATPPLRGWAGLPEVPEPNLGSGWPEVPEHEAATPPLPNLGSEWPEVPEHEAATPPLLNLGWAGWPEGLENEVVHGPPPSPKSTDPELHLDHQSLSQPTDILAAIYKVKGKSKVESRRISRDVGDVAQRELASR